MSNPDLPAELLDRIVDFLHDAQDALRNCCLVSKPWIPWTQKHLFADVQFDNRDDLESWKELFPDPLGSPAHYTKTLFVGSLHFATATDAEPGGWIRGFFYRVLALKVGDLGTYLDEPGANLVPFHGFSPVIKSLFVQVPTLLSSQALDLILSFPLLNDLTVVTYKSLIDDNGGPGGLRTITIPSPPMTGSLTLIRREGLKSLARRLLSLPGGINFQKLSLKLLREEDISLATALVEGCSHTLESLDISCEYIGVSVWCCAHFDNLPLILAEPRSGPIGLSKAIGLKNVTFRVGSQNVGWITTAFKTITPEGRDLQRIYLPHNLAFVNVGADIRQSIGEAISRRWSDLDYLLVEFWESHSIRPRVGCERLGEKQRNMDYCIGRLLPGITKMGIVDPF